MRRYVLAVLGLFLAFAAPVHSALLFNTNATWKYFKGRTEASTPDRTAWRGVNFDDAAFTVSPAPFWYDVTGDSSTLSGGTKLTDMQNQYTCIFLRRTFVLSDLANIGALRFGANCDDGYIVWINGTEVQRYNVPGAIGTNPLFSDGASAAATEPVPFNFSDLVNPAPSSYLLLNTNVIAVQVFNAGTASSDLDFDCSLSTTEPDLIPPTIANISPAPGTLSSLSQITVTFSEPVGGVNAADLLINGLPATAMTGGNDT